MDCHVCSVTTHKGHLLLVHLLQQLLWMLHGLGEKMEDLVEAQHQFGTSQQRRFRTQGDM
jgi:hypothetical protein